MPHFGHIILFVEAMDGVLIEVVCGVLGMSSRAGLGRRDTYLRVIRAGLGQRDKYLRVTRLVAGGGDDAHTVCDIDPDEPVNMESLFAFEWTQAARQSF